MSDPDLDATQRLLRERLAELDARIAGLAKAPERVLCIDCARFASRR